MLWIIRSWVQRGGAAVLVDTAGTAAPSRPAWLPELGKFYNVSSIPELGRSLRQLPSGSLVRWVPGFDTETDPAWRLIYSRGRLLLAIDEAEEYANAWRVDPNLARLLSHGRHRAVSIVATVRLPHELHGRFRGLADRTVSFRQGSSYYARILARDAYGDPELAPTLRDLPPFSYVLQDGGRRAVGQVSPLPSE
jgi:hypothetical protein